MTCSTCRAIASWSRATPGAVPRRAGRPGPVRDHQGQPARALVHRGDLVRDLAALNKVETLPWDVWGAMPGPDAPLRDDQLALFDRLLAALTQKPDASFAEVRGLYEDDGRLRVPGTVFNSLLQRQEAI